MCSIHNFARMALVASCLAGAIPAFGQTQRATTAPTTKRSGASATASNTTPPSGTGTAPQTRTGAAAPKGTAKLAEAPGRAVIPNNKPRQAPPKAQPFRIPKVTKEVEDLLIEWEQKSSKIQRLQGTFKRVTYDDTFAIEKHAEGKFCFEHPDKGSLQQTGIKNAESFPSKKYTPKVGDDERWVCDGEHIMRIDDKARQYEKIEIPEADRGKNIRNSPLPFLFGMKAEEAKARYGFEIIKQNEVLIQLRVIPKLQLDTANYTKAEVQLDRKTFIPTAVKLYDTSGSKADLYVFDHRNLAINKTSNLAAWFGSDPLKPSLGRYKEVLNNNEGAAVPPGTQLAPRPTDRRSAVIGPARNGTAPKQGPQQTASRLNAEEDVPRVSIKPKVRTTP